MADDADDVTQAECDLIGWYLRNTDPDSDDFTITIGRENGRWHAQLVNEWSGEVNAGRGLSFDEAWTEAMKGLGGLLA